MDGTAGSPALVADFLPGDDGSYPGWLTAGAGRVFFTVNDGAHGRELWWTGVGGEPILVDDIMPGEGSAKPRNLIYVPD